MSKTHKNFDLAIVRPTRSILILYTDDIWLGGDDLVQEGLWTWSYSGSTLEYGNWAAGQPDNSHGEHCMELDQDTHMWNDEQCDHHKHYICMTRSD